MILSLTDEEDFKFDKGYQVLYFYNTNMLYNKRMLNVIDFLDKKYNNINFYIIDLYKINSYIKRFNITEVPTICIFSDGREKKRIKGLAMASAIKSSFSEIIK